VTAGIAVVRACADEVRAGRIGERDAVCILTVTVRDLLTGPAARQHISINRLID
jgi:hypothetical protein